MRTLYLDYNATTPLDPAVRAAMLPFLDGIWGNPSSVHHVGRRARAHLDDARDRVARAWHCKPSEVVFTSGGTESNNLAVLGAARHLRPRGRHLITSSIEHHAVLHSFQYLQKHEGFDVTFLPVGTDGVVDPGDLRKSLRPDTTLVSVMAANNETGALQPVVELGKICRARGVLFHTDAVQSFGKEEFKNIDQFEAGLVSICAHKLYGPKGAGALFIKSPLLPDPILFGGGHENERRAGTENLAGIIGLVEVIERHLAPPVFEQERLRPMADRLAAEFSAMEGVCLHGRGGSHLSNTVACTVEGADSIALLAGLDLAGVCASSGSACTAGSLEPSHVLLAMGVEKSRANSLLRFSLGRETTPEDIESLPPILRSVIDRIRSVSPRPD